MTVSITCMVTMTVAVTGEYDNGNDMGGDNDSGSDR